MIRAGMLRELSLERSSADSAGIRYLSAASGIVAVADSLYVVADDELALAMFDRDGFAAGVLVPLLARQLPDDAAARKAAKPDLEVLVRLPPFDAHPAGALLALGSGSRPNRRVGVVLGLDASGRVDTAPRRLDLSALYLTLERALPALNIEGAVVVGDQLRLFHRGSRGDPESAVICVRLADVVAPPALDRAAPDQGPIAIRRIDLGLVDGVALGFTDAAPLPDGRIVFSAVAEASDDAYQDGRCVAAAVGLLGADGIVQSMQRLDPLHKIEGVHAELDGDVLRLLMVTDGDDRRIPARLLRADVPIASFG